MLAFEARGSASSSAASRRRRGPGLAPRGVVDYEANARRDARPRQDRSPGSAWARAVAGALAPMWHAHLRGRWRTARWRCVSFARRAARAPYLLRTRGCALAEARRIARAVRERRRCVLRSGYDGSALPAPRRTRRAAAPERVLTALREAEVDYVVVGTGAGGATAALVLAEAGRSLLMLAKGPTCAPSRGPAPCGRRCAAFARRRAATHDRNRCRVQGASSAEAHRNQLRHRVALAAHRAAAVGA